MGPENDCYDRYWKLDYSKYDLDEWRDFRAEVAIVKVKQAGYKDVKYSDGQEEVIRLMRRIDRGLLCYHRCSITELEKFIHNRKLTVAQPRGTRGKAKKARLIKALEHADDDVLFSQLLDLPVELRNKIYELSMAHYPRLLKSPTKPPLSRVCKQLRNEVLPIFYGRHTFRLVYGRPTMSYNDELSFPETVTTAAFLSAIPSDNTCFLRKVEVNLDKLSQLRGSTERDREFEACGKTVVACKVSLDAGRGRGKAAIVQVPAPVKKGGQTLKELCLNHRTRFQEEMDEVLKGVRERDGPKRLTFCDLRALRDAAQNAYDRALGAVL